MQRKIGYNDLDPDVINDVVQSAATGKVHYNDKALKDKIKMMQTQLNYLKTNGANASFNKNTDKVTMSMLESGLANTINDIVKAISNNGQDQQVINESTKNKIISLQSLYSQEAQERANADAKHNAAIASLEKSLNDLKVAIESGSSDVMTGATATQNGTAGIVPAPKAGEEKYVLLGDAKWTNQDELCVGAALKDKNNNDITTYFSNAEYDANEKKLIFTNGSGIKTEVSLA